MKDLTRGNHDAFGCWIQFWHTRKWHAFIHNDQNPFLHETEYKASTIYFLFPLHLLIIFPPVWHNMDSSLPSYNLLNFESIRFNILPSHSFITRIFKPSPFIYMKFFLKRSIMLLTFLFRVNVRTLLIHMQFYICKWVKCRRKLKCTFYVFEP